ncbi:MAG TPA: hypothetical protein VNH64_02080, partial [Parvularculaceae bacterium]|nr:hypothetical protein [Parvularculaceae bacterium]
MNALMMRLAVSMASLVLALATSSAHAAGASMDKYGFSVVFPNGYEICETRPAGFLHGYYVRLDHRSCGSDKPGSAMGLYADFNTTLYSDVRSGFLPGCLPPSLDSPMSQLRFSTLESAVCWRNGKHGRKEIHVEA